MKSLIAPILFLFSSLLSSLAFATPSFTNLTSDDLTNIANEASANFTHNSMLGASKLGTLFGFQVGLVAAKTASPKMNEIAKRNNTDLPELYNAGILAAVGIPFGISGEMVLIPKITASGTDLNSTSLALKWNINEIIPVLPVNVALRGVYSDAKISFAQTISGTTATVDNKTKVNGLQLLISPMFPVFEPYAGIGQLSGSNELTVSGTGGTVFDPNFSSTQSEKKTVSSTQVLLGAEVNLALVKLGLEYSQAFGTNRFGLKFAMGF